MIHIRKEGEFLRLGVNITFTPGRLTVCWAWFNFSRQEGSARGFTVSRHGFRSRTDRWNVVDNYLRRHNLTVVQEEVLQDLKEIETDFKKRNDEYAYVSHIARNG